MTPEEIIQAYDVVAQDVRNKTAQEAAKIGNSQRSLGTLAERVASPTGQTTGLANYTYNRTLRPTVDVATNTLVTQGKAQALQTELTNQLLAAKQAYEDAKNRYTVASTTPKTTPATTANKYTEDTVTDSTVDAIVSSYVPYAVIDGVQYYWNPDTKHVYINGKELDMTPEEYVAQQEKKYEAPPMGSNIFDTMKNVREYNRNGGEIRG